MLFCDVSFLMIQIIKQGKLNTEKPTEVIINIGKSWIDLGVKRVIILLILPKNNIALTRLIQQLKDNLKDSAN